MFSIIVHGAATQTRENLEKFDLKIREIFRLNFPHHNREEILIFFPAEILSNGVFISISWIKYLDKKGKKKLVSDLLDEAIKIFSYETLIKIKIESEEGYVGISGETGSRIYCCD